MRKITKCDRTDCNKIPTSPVYANEGCTLWTFCSQRCSNMFGGVNVNYNLYKVIADNNKNYFIYAYDEEDLKEKCEKENIKIISFSIKRD
jgi:hypothetical protein